MDPRSATGATTLTTPMLAHPTAITDQTGSLAASLSALAPGTTTAGTATRDIAADTVATDIEADTSLEAVTPVAIAAAMRAESLADTSVQHAVTLAVLVSPAVDMRAAVPVAASPVAAADSMAAVATAVVDIGNCSVR